MITYWFGLAFPLDQRFADAIKGTTRLDLTFVQTDVPGGGAPRVLASTLSSDQALEVAAPILHAIGARMGPERPIVLVPGLDEDAAGERPVVSRPVGPVPPHPLRGVPG